MKYVFMLVLLIVSAAAGLFALVVVIRWNDNMTATPKVMPGERVFAMPAGVIPRGGSLILPKEQREAAAKQPNPLKPTPESIALARNASRRSACPATVPKPREA